MYPTGIKACKKALRVIFAKGFCRVNEDHQKKMIMSIINVGMRMAQDQPM